MPVLAELFQLTPADTKALRRDLRQIEATIPGCRWLAVSETLGRIGHVKAGQGQTHRPLYDLNRVVREFHYMARQPFLEFEGGDRILFAIAVVDRKNKVRAVLTLSKFCGFTLTQSKRPENDRPQREPWQEKIRPGDTGGVGARMPKVRRMNRHLSHEAPIPEGQDLRTARRV